VLLLGVGGVGFYFSNSPPQPTDLRKRIVEFVNTYDGGDCFFVEPVTVKDGAVTLAGLGTSASQSETPASFWVLNDNFRRQFGFEADIGVRWVTLEQCPAVNFLSRTKNQPGTTPRLDIDVSALQDPGGSLRGSVAEFGDRHIELVLI